MIINYFDLESLLVLILAGILYKLNDANTFVEPFIRRTTTMNLVTKTSFFEIMYCGIIEHWLVPDSKCERFFGLISTYLT